MRDAARQVDGGFGIYIHWPFCTAKCPYCDFNSHVRRNVDQQEWRHALCRDLTSQADDVHGGQVESIFFGGGTPSLMDASTVAALIDKIAAIWPVCDDLEVTLEANPTSVEAGRFADYAAVGVNRISMGVQSLRDADLRALGRLHSAAEARAAFDIARREFDRVSFDLIYARQNQSLAAWQSELSEALAMAVDHLSLYQLTIEAGTRFGDLYQAGRLRGLPNDDIAADMYELTQELCLAAGMPAYEISNHARPGAECRHNLVYWRGGSYLGIGPGAHGRYTNHGGRFASEAVRSPEVWLERVASSGTGVHKIDEISPADQAAEYLMMSMRLEEGTDLARFEQLSGGPLDDTVLISLASDGLVQQANDRLRATPKGRLVLNAVLRELLT